MIFHSRPGIQIFPGGIGSDQIFYGLNTDLYLFVHQKDFGYLYISNNPENCIYSFFTRTFQSEYSFGTRPIR